MNFVKLSETQLVNLDRVTRIEIFESEEVKYTTMHFVDGESYRCTEEESSVLLPHVETHLNKVL